MSRQIKRGRVREREAASLNSSVKANRTRIEREREKRECVSLSPSDDVERKKEGGCASLGSNDSVGKGERVIVSKCALVSETYCSLRPEARRERSREQEWPQVMIHRSRLFYTMLTTLILHEVEVATVSRSSHDVVTRRRSGKLPWTQLPIKRLEALFIG